MNKNVDLIYLIAYLPFIPKVSELHNVISAYMMVKSQPSFRTKLQPLPQTPRCMHKAKKSK